MVTRDATRYDRRMSSRRPLIRLVVIPAALFLVVSGSVYALAKAHPATPGVPKAAGPGDGQVVLGDPSRGATVFRQSCASCHGDAGEGGGVGPRLAGSGITVAAAKAQIDHGGGVMPAAIVTGRAEQDVLAYLAGVMPPG
jgi:mono/diheme cytochrome c family protein